MRIHCDCKEVSANELGEVLLGFFEIFVEANRKAGNPPIIIKINNLEIGSIELTSILELWNDTKNMVLGSDAQAILGIIDLLTICRQVFADIRNIKR